MPDIQLRGGHVTQDPRLDRIPSQDPRSQNFPIRELIPTEVLPVAKYWSLGPVTDQGREGACVGFGWTSDAMASPARVHIGTPQEYVRRLTYEANRDQWASDLYHTAQTMDEWWGEDYEGTSVLAGAKAMQSKGLIDSYRWAESVTDIRDTLILRGPVVIGVNWYEDMYGTEASGRVRIGGQLVGGHCLLVYGYNPRYWIEGRYQEIYRWRNSWGASYGINGKGFLTGTDFRTLFERDGEGCVPLGRHDTPSI